MSVQCRLLPEQRPCRSAGCERPECQARKTIAIPQRVMDIVTDKGIPFRVAYGNRPYAKGELAKFPTVAFYDTRYTLNSPLHAHGQFVSDYSREALMARKQGYALDLYGGEPDWTIDAATLYVVMTWLNHMVWQEEN